MTVIAVTLPLSLAYAGLTALALALKRHHEAAIGAKPPATRLRAFRVAGWVLMALMVASCLRLWPTGLALSMALGLTYCPKYSELKPQPCPRPPLRSALIVEINKEIARQYGPAKCLTSTPQRMPEL